MIEFEINGTKYTDFISAAVNLSMASLANDFRFVSSSVNSFPPFKQGDEISAIVDGERMMTGYIDEISGTEAGGVYEITYSGRDKTGDLIDSQIDIIDDIRSDGLTLKTLIGKVLSHLGLSISVIDEYSPAAFNLAEDFISPQPGESAIGFLLKYARKRQALLSTDGDGNIVITQSSPTDPGDALQSAVGSNSNNVISQNWAIDSRKAFNRYVHRGQLDLRALNFGGETDIATAINQGAEVTYSPSRTGRQRVIVEDGGYSTAQLRSRALWSRQFGIAGALRYTCAVKGHQRPSDGVWRENTLAQVVADAANINEKMLIESVTFTQGNEIPTITTLQLVDKRAYTTDSKRLNRRQAGESADAFTVLG